MILGARVGPMIRGQYRKSDFPGATATEASGGNASSADLGMDVPTWVKEELVDYLCPSLWWPKLPGIPRTAEYAALAKDKPVGIYPTVFPLPAWAIDNLPGDELSAAETAAMMRRHRDEICRAALQCYADGADGVSTFNWFGHSQFSHLAKQEGFGRSTYGATLFYKRTELFVHRFLSSPEALRECLQKEPTTDPEPMWPT